MQIASWNVNSIRARLPLVLEWLHATAPDVCCLQETKCTGEAFPHDAFVDLGYEVAHHGVNHWNGVAILSRVGMADIQRGFSGVQQPPFDEPRLIAATCNGVHVASLYVPNGRALDDPHYLFKLVWLERLRCELLHAGMPERPSVVLGDFNVAPADMDIYEPKRWRRKTHASAPERAAITALLDLGFHDLAREWSPDEPAFTWWNYRSPVSENRGMRIDLALGSSHVRNALVGVHVDRAARSAPQPSDHAPLVIEIAE